MATDASIRDAVKLWNQKARERDSDAEKMEVKRIDTAQATLKLEYIDEVVVLSYPKTTDSIWFCTGPDWLAGDLNASILSGLMAFNQILSAIASRVEKRVLTGSLLLSGSSGMEESLGASAAGLEASGMYGGNDDGNFALSNDDLQELKMQVNEAQAVLGESAIVLVPELGSVKMTLDVYSMLNELVAKALGLQPDEPVFVSFSFEKSHIPHVSCTQRVAPGYGVKNHLKGIFEYFFHCWHNDRGKLKKVGRPPAGLVAVNPAAAAAAAGGGNNNNVAAPEAAAAAVAGAEKEKTSWWKNMFGGAKESDSLTTVSERSVRTVMDMGFDAVACVRALAESRNDPDKATMLLVNKPTGYAATKKQLETLQRLQAKHVEQGLAAAALIKNKFNFEAALAAATGPQAAECWKVPGKAPVKSVKVKKNAGGGKEVDAEDHPYNQENFVFALLSFLQERLGHYSSYCVCCHGPHSCFNPDGGVVCSEALCVFQLEESPMEKLMSVHLCPFKDCCDLDLSTVGKEFMGLPLDTICKQYGLTGQQLLEMLLHRYLPTDQIKLMLENGLKTFQCKRLESVLNPTLCARFEHRWKELRERHGGDKSVRVAPCVAYHGTSEQNVKGILDTGFLLNKLSQGSGDNGWFGCGIYFSQHVQTAMGYCRGRQMMCAVLMGKVYKCPGRMDGAKLQDGYDSHEDPSGYEWVIYHEASILPVYVIHNA